jgi:hypothetical protein
MNAHVPTEQRMVTCDEVSELRTRSIPAYFMADAFHWALRLAEMMPGANDERVLAWCGESGEVSACDRLDYRSDLAAVRLLEAWEELGIRVHIAAGLPTARQAAEIVRQRPRNLDSSALTAHTEKIVNPDADSDWLTGHVVEIDPNAFWPRVMVFAVEHFASTAAGVWGADIPIEPGDDDPLIERMAAYLWRHRHDLPLDGEINLESVE